MDAKLVEFEEAPKAGGKFPTENPVDCPEAKPNPEFEPPNCELLLKPKFDDTEEYAGGSPGGGGGFVNANGCDDTADEAENMLEWVGDGKENGLLKGVGEAMESAALGNVAAGEFLLPPRWTVKTTPSLKLRDEPNARAASKLSSVSK